MKKAFTDVIRELVDERPETMDYKTELVKFSVAIARGVGRTLLTVSKARRYVGPQPKAKAQSQSTSAAARKTTAEGGAKAGPSAGDGQ